MHACMHSACKCIIHACASCIQSIALFLYFRVHDDAHNKTVKQANYDYLTEKITQVLLCAIHLLNHFQDTIIIALQRLWHLQGYLSTKVDLRSNETTIVT